MDVPQTLRPDLGFSPPMKRDAVMAPIQSPEMELLCVCTRPGEHSEPTDGPFPPRPVDWSRFRTLATNHHVIPSTYRALKAVAKKKSANIPVEFLACLQRDYMAIAAHNLRATATLCRLQDLLEAQGIRLVPIKGPVLGVLAYGSTSMRQFEDLDLLVPVKDLLRAVDLLEQEGYSAREIPAAASRIRYLASLQDWSLQKPGEALHLDLKPVLIAHTLAGPQTADFMSEACRPIETGAGRSVLAPGPEAMLLAVCMDGANEMWAKLSSVADAGALLSNVAGADWAGLLRDAARFGQKRSLLTGALLAELLLGCPLPEAFRKEARRDAPAGRLAKTAADRMLSERSLQTGVVRQSWFAFQTRDRFRDRARFLYRLLFVPGAADLNQISLPDAWYPLYSCLRPFRLAWDAVRGKPRRIVAAKAKSEP